MGALSEASQSKQIVYRVAEALAEQQGQDTIALDVRENSDFADYLIITTARSQTHLNGLYRRAHEELDSHGRTPRQSVKRVSESGWVLLDCDDIIVHLMLKEQREFYELERLWFDAIRVFPLQDKGNFPDQTDTTGGD